MRKCGSSRREPSYCIRGSIGNDNGNGNGNQTSIIADSLVNLEYGANRAFIENGQVKSVLEASKVTMET
jgi:hypothetical protein